MAAIRRAWCRRWLLVTVLLAHQPAVAVAAAARVVARTVSGVSMSARASFDLGSFSSLLRTRAVGRQVAAFAETDSTMQRAAATLRELGPRAAHGALVVADAQTDGIGRRGRSWHSAPGANLLFSCVWAPPHLEGTQPAELIAHMVQLNLAVPVAVAKSCEAAGITDARVKWPNDVWARGRKLSGTIVDFDGTSAAIVGVGINVNELTLQSDDAAGGSGAGRGPVVSPICIRELLGSAESVPREPLLAGVCSSLEELMALDMRALLAEYSARDLLRGRRLRVHHASREEADPRDYDAIALGVTDGGLLRVSRGSEVLALSGEEISISPEELLSSAVRPE